MSNPMNYCILIGRLADEPAHGTTTDGKERVSFTIAVNGQGKDAKADFIKVSGWGATANFINRYFHKGKPIAIIGRIHTYTYKDANGEPHKAFEVVADNVSFVPGDTPKAKDDAAPETFEIISSDEDLPF